MTYLGYRRRWSSTSHVRQRSAPAGHFCLSEVVLAPGVLLLGGLPVSPLLPERAFPTLNQRTADHPLLPNVGTRCGCGRRGGRPRGLPPVTGGRCQRTPKSTPMRNRDGTGHGSDSCGELREGVDGPLSKGREAVLTGVLCGTLHNSARAGALRRGVLFLERAHDVGPIQVRE